MTEKRFTVIDREEPRKQSVAEKGIPCTARHCCTRLNRLTEENKELKKDNTNLMMVLKNQSIIIQELYSKLLEYELKEPKESIVLTKEDLEIMGKAISYYTHGRCGE